MSTHNKESHYENHQRAAELENMAAHTHNSAAQQQGKQDHQTGHENSRQFLEHSEQTHLHAEQVHSGGSQQPGGSHQVHIASFGHTEIAALAYELWHARGCPEGSADEDWFRAAQHLRAANEHSVGERKGAKSNE